MPLVLHRIDDRLIHGQVVIGWGRPLGVGFIALIDDQVASSDWEQDLYRMGVPPEVEVFFAGVIEAARRAPEWRSDARPGILLTADIATMVAFRQKAPPVEEVNLGGLHHKPGRSLRLPYIYLTDDEYRSLEALEASGTRVTAQDLPTAPAVPLEALK
jgi:PTS system mannose-specific IIB component/fructoselysine and glucoselysine-specific PTS system IIB component